jgi:hypothetical protein
MVDNPDGLIVELDPKSPAFESTTPDNLTDHSLPASSLRTIQLLLAPTAAFLRKIASKTVEMKKTVIHGNWPHGDYKITFQNGSNQIELEIDPFAFRKNVKCIINLVTGKISDFKSQLTIDKQDWYPSDPDESALRQIAWILANLTSGFAAYSWDEQDANPR